jgi:hypothetical protein
MKRSIQDQSKFSRTAQAAKWFIENRAKSSIFVFAFLVIFGSIIGVVIKLTSGNSPQAATTQEQAQSAAAIPGWWYSEHFGVSVCEQDNCKLESDPDGDKLTNAQEYFYSTNPTNKDTNANGNTDGEDVAFGYAPNKPGKVTFEEAGSDDSIVGESLLFNNEIKDIIVNMTDLSKTVTPEINDAELNISTNNSQEAFIDYMLELDRISKKFYASDTQYAGLSEQIKQQNSGVINQLKLTALQVTDEYKKASVPSDALQFHKYHIALWTLVPTLIELPANDGVNALYQDDANKWFDSAQAMVALNQKLDVELLKLRSKYEFQ